MSTTISLPAAPVPNSGSALFARQKGVDYIGKTDTDGSAVWSALSDAFGVDPGDPLALPALLKSTTIEWSVDSIAALRAVPTAVFTRIAVYGYYAKADFGGVRHYYPDLTDTTSADNGGTIIIGYAGVRLKMNYSGALNVQLFGADPTGVKDSTAAFRAVSGFPQNTTVDVPTGAYNLTSIATPLVFNNIVLRGDGSQTTIVNCKVKLGTGVPFISVQGFNNNNYAISGINFNGPSSGRVMGSKTAQCDGVKIGCKASFEDVYVTNFDSGFVWNSTGGHISMYNCMAQYNYYGIYDLTDNQDNLIIGGLYNGNAMAGIGIAYNQFLCATITRAHGGFQPYGIYREAAPAGSSPYPIFLLACTITTFVFEAVGSSAIYDENVSTAPTLSAVRGCTIINSSCQITNATYTDPNTGVRDYMFKCGSASSLLIIDGSSTWGNTGGAPNGGIYIAAGSHGNEITHFVAGTASFIVFGNAPAAATSGYRAFAPAVAGGFTLPSGATSVTVNTGIPAAYPFTAPKIAPILGAAAVTAPYWISSITQTGGIWQFVVSIQTAPPASVTFSWSAE